MTHRGSVHQDGRLFGAAVLSPSSVSLRQMCCCLSGQHSRINLLPRISRKCVMRIILPPLILLLLLVPVPAAPPSDSATEPLLRVVDLNEGETVRVSLCDGTEVELSLISVTEHRDRIRQAVRSVDLEIAIDGTHYTLHAGPWSLPETLGPVQIDCTVTKGYNRNGTPEFWGLDKDARLRLWPAGSPLLRAGSMISPIRQRWLATRAWFDNEPVDGGPEIRQQTYYHAGIDIGASEGLVDVIAATDALVVQKGTDVLDGHGEGFPTAPRYDVLYLLDDRGWYYRYSHLKEFDAGVKLGARVRQGDRLGVVGKEGASGGWSHLHFEIKSRQPSGKWGTQAAYAFLREAAIRDEQRTVIANGRRAHFIVAGEQATLDASRSWSASGRLRAVEWLFDDGTVGHGMRVKRTYSHPGIFNETLKVTDSAGNVDYDFATVHVLNPDDLNHYSPNLNANFSPTLGIRPGTPITFKVRGFRYQGGQEMWDFGDGSPQQTTRSDETLEPLAAAGYAEIRHRYEQPGDYIVIVQRTDSSGITSNAKLHVRVEE